MTELSDLLHKDSFQYIFLKSNIDILIQFY